MSFFCRNFAGGKQEQFHEKITRRYRDDSTLHTTTLKNESIGVVFISGVLTNAPCSCVCQKNFVPLQAEILTTQIFESITQQPLERSFL